MQEIIPMLNAEQTIHGRFEDLAKTFPDNISLRSGAATMTYGQLNQASNRIAHEIIDAIGPEPCNVALHIENGILQVATILGILKAGKSYVGLDPAFPPDRNRYMLQDAQCPLMISNMQNEAEAGQLSAGSRLILADRPGKAYPVLNPGPLTDPEGLAMIFYTSGSTGRPKGAMQSHKNMVHYCRRLDGIVDFKREDRFSCYLSIAFSAHAFTLLASLLNGCELVIYDRELDDLGDFKRWLSDMKITVAMTIPSIARHLQAVFDKSERLNFIRILFIGGETLYRSDVEKVRRILKKNALIVNIYASSEAYLSAAFVMKPDTPLRGNIVPIGHPVRDMEIMILDEEGNPVESDNIGELFIRSPYVMKGYWNREEQNAAVILKDKEDEHRRIFKSSDTGYFIEKDCIVCIGRKDAVIKLRGYRIDMGEIENVLLENPDVKEAACRLMKNRFGIEKIIAFIVPVGTRRPDIEFIKATTVRMLPDYMLPSHLVVLDALPRNDIGKIDYNAIPEPDWDALEGSGEKVQPRNDVEKALVGIFEKTLRIQPIGINDDLLRLGADSLSLFVAFDNIQKAFGKKIDFDKVTEHPTIEAISKFIGEF